MKYIKISIVILLVSFISIFAYKLTTNNSNNKLSLTKEQMKEMISYTIDGNSTSSMPTKGSGYKVKSITCKSGSILSWDNDNWLLEVEKLESEDLCNIDFTTGTGSYTVTAVPSIAGSLDSTSKTTTENGQVTFFTNAIIDSVSGCTNEISDGKVIVKNVTSNTICNINVSYMKLYDKLLSDKSTRPGARTDFSKVLTNDNTNTLYTSTENRTTVYYFAGNATDNWVKFGKNASNQDLYWRIIRTNSDGGVRLLYHGTSTTATDAYIGTSAFNSTRDNPMYVGYMYGTSGSLVNNRTNANNSTIKTTIDNWYKDNLNSNYGKYISTTAVYCNDRSVTNGTYSTSSSFDYAAYTRLKTNKTPSYDCAATEDKFTVDSSTGNGKLKYPIALMTADEVLFAGGLYGTNAPTWYYKNSANGSSTGDTWWWLLSPSIWGGSHAHVFGVGGSSNPGGLYNNLVSGTLGVRPVLSLKADVLYKSGDGSAESPYEIQETPDTISDVIKANAVNENGYRYEGSDPNNYIQMKKTDGTTEMWRIIGLFPDGENGEDVIRVRRHYELNNYPTSKFNLQEGVSNIFTNSYIRNTTLADYTTSAYKHTTSFKIYIGGTNTTQYTASTLYSNERTSNIIGEVALMYPSDYGYAVLASDCARTIPIDKGGYNTVSACYNNNWLFHSALSETYAQWLISPYSSNFVFNISSTGYADGYYMATERLYNPVMALKSDVKVTGSGTASDPYIMK